jgi:type IV pilus assembly protein PilE
MKRLHGFTLVELMIVVAIIGILASIGIPAYRDYVIRSQLAEAYSMLGAQRVKMEQFYQDNRTYTGACDPGTVATPATGDHFTITGCGINDQTYTIVATGQDALSDFVFTIDQNNVRTTQSAPSGWTTNNTCWIRSRSGHC